MTIYNFKKGDKITRIKPSKSYSNGYKNMRYIGDKLIFICIANGLIYLKRTDCFFNKIFGNRIINLPVYLWSKNWVKFIEPNIIMDIDENIIDTSKKLTDTSKKLTDSPAFRHLLKISRRESTKILENMDNELKEKLKS